MGLMARHPFSAEAEPAQHSVTARHQIASMWLQHGGGAAAAALRGSSSGGELGQFVSQHGMLDASPVSSPAHGHGQRPDTFASGAKHA